MGAGIIEGARIYNASSKLIGRVKTIADDGKTLTLEAGALETIAKNAQFKKENMTSNNFVKGAQVAGLSEIEVASTTTGTEYASTGDTDTAFPVGTMLYDSKHNFIGEVSKSSSTKSKV